MTLDTYLSGSQRNVITQYENIINRAPVLGIPFFHLKQNELYEHIKRNPTLGNSYAQFIAPKLGVNPSVVARDDMRAVFYAVLDSLTRASAPLTMELEQLVRTGANITLEQLKKLTSKYGIDVVSAYHFLEFIRSFGSYNTTQSVTQDNTNTSSLNNQGTQQGP